MHTFQISSHVNENSILSVKLPKEWAEKNVNAVLVLESLDVPQTAHPPGNLAAAFDLLAQMPEDFMEHRQKALASKMDINE